MSEADRIEWLKAAMEVIGDIPQDLLESACAKAMRVCDHPAKIVPFICQETDDSVKWRRINLRTAQTKLENIEKPRLQKQGFELDGEDRRAVSVGIGELLAELEAKVRVD
jgi:hypothetical protein